MPLDPTGYSPTLVDEFLEDIEEDQRANIDPALDQQPEEPLGQINGIVAAALAELDENILAVYRSAYADSAEGESLDAICALTGVVRLPAAPSTVTLTLGGTNGTVIPAGRIVGSPTTGKTFTTLEQVTISGGAATVEAGCTEDGPVSANASTLTRIDTPVSGWTTVLNAADATLGRDVETDADLRIRRRALLFAAGNATVNALRADVLAVDGVTACNVFENDTNATDADGVPPHAFEVVVVGGDDTDIAEAILASKAAGILAHGTTTETVEDSQGFEHEIGFTRPAEVGILVSIDVAVVADDFPADGEDQIAEAVAEHINELGVGVDVVRTKLIKIVLGISGVEDVTDLEIAYVIGASFGTANLAISPREMAVCDVDTGISVETTEYEDLP